MAQLLVRDVSAATVESLKRRARANRRSLQNELKEIIDHAARMNFEEFREAADRIRNSLKGRRFRDSTDLVREDRER